MTTTYSLDTSVLISHLKGDSFADASDRFFRRMIEKKIGLVIPDIVYAELYTGIYLSDNPNSEEARVQRFLAVNGIEIRTSRSLKIAKRAGELYSKYLMNRASSRRILPDFLIAAQVETTSAAFVTWNVPDYENLGLTIPVLPPNRA
ncbi:MAG: type II toxin-antitoxin system VapC family toxin [Nitrososphaerota archaeon]|nr:type II toxin-antitoxin system VapC family toxin [Nitrososphaerota archaeon]